jgi:hypothetical protein
VPLEYRPESRGELRLVLEHVNNRGGVNQTQSGSGSQKLDSRAWRDSYGDHDMTGEWVGRSPSRWACYRRILSA